jgi:NAD-dependent SIR2 family protein deacetylase
MCKGCKQDEVLKPNITFFGEEIPRTVSDSISSDKNKVFI